MTLFTLPITLEDANEFVRQHHRHHGRVVGHKFSIAATDGQKICGICIVGRPVARLRQDGLTLEVSRMCSDGTRNVCSFLYGAAARAAFAMGYQRIGTYIRADETGVSLSAAGWRRVAEVRGRSWNCESRPRVDRTEIVDRHLFERRLA